MSVRLHFEAPSQKALSDEPIALTFSGGIIDGNRDSRQCESGGAFSSGGAAVLAALGAAFDRRGLAGAESCEVGGPQMTLHEILVCY